MLTAFASRPVLRPVATRSALSLDPKQQQTVLYASDLELGETTKMTFDEVRRIAAARVVFDSSSEIRLCAENPLRYRRQVIALKHYFAQQRCIVSLLDDLIEETDDLTCVAWCTAWYISSTTRYNTGQSGAQAAHLQDARTQFSWRLP
jgi:hypothetical protein